MVRRERVCEGHRRGFHPPRAALEVGEPPCLADDSRELVGVGVRVGDAAAGGHDEVEGLGVEFTGYRETQVALVVGNS